MKGKTLTLLLCVLFLLAVGCTEVNPESNQVSLEEMNHVGCQEKEISKSGGCDLAEDNNVKLFGQDLSSVQTEDVDCLQRCHDFLEDKEYGNATIVL